MIDNPMFRKVGEVSLVELTKRELFAAMAMQGMLSNSFVMNTIADSLKKISRTDDEAIVASSAQQYADALLNQLEKTEGEIT